MGKKKTKRIYNRISSEEQAQLHTASWWYNHKYLLITGAIGEDMYPNGYKQDVCTYYAADQVRCMSPEEAHARNILSPGWGLLVITDDADSKRFSRSVRVAEKAKMSSGVMRDQTLSTALIKLL